MLETQRFCLFASLTLTFTAAFAFAQAPGQPLRIDVTADTWVSNVGKEADGNNGGAPQLKTKGVQEMTLLDIDPASLAGRVITAATLHLHCTSEDIQRRVTVSTLATPWVEGTGTGYVVQPGSASFNFAQQGKLPWAGPGSDLTAVCNSVGNTIWRFADATAPDSNGWQTIAVDPAVVAARVAGISHGFVVIDDVGSEYTRDGEKFTYHMFPNRFVSSREGGKNVVPYFTVSLGAEDREPPQAVAQLAATPDSAVPAQASVNWTTPADRGPAGVIGFLARYSTDSNFDWAKATPIPQYLVPRPSSIGKPVAMQLRGLPIEAGTSMTIAVAAVDAAGNIGPISTCPAQLSARPAELAVTVARPSAPAQLASAALRLGDLDVAIVESLDKLQPGASKFIPAMPDTYRRHNQLFDSTRQVITLSAARNEFVDFQVLLSGKAAGVTASISFDPEADAAAEKITSDLNRYVYVETTTGPLPDPLIPLTGPFAVPDDRGGASTRPVSLLSDIYVPHTASAGVHKGKLALKQGDSELVVPIELTVWNFTLSDRLSFIPEMNSYGLPDGPGMVQWYRLAHANRTCLNRLGYGWNGSVNSACAPQWNGSEFSWAQYDKTFGPLLDGSAFADLPRKGVPVDAFYLPICENWPIAIEPAFKGGYWPEQALTQQYARDFAAACGKFAAHLADKKWNDTFFEFYLNNKVYYKEQGGWSRCSAPWIFDEPVNTQDFWALRYYGELFHNGIADYRGQAKLAYRGDISRPEWQRDILDGLLDVNVVGGGFRTYQTMISDRKKRDGQILVNYGSANRIEDSNWHAVAWCLDSWRLGADGILPWQTIGTDDSWKKGDALSLFYPGQPAGIDGPVPSIRLKAYRRGQQLVEYLVMLEQSKRYTHWQLNQLLLKHLSMAGQLKKTSEEDAGTVNYPAVTSDLVWQLRQQLGMELDKLHPPARRQWVDLSTPARNPKALPDMGYIRAAKNNDNAR